MTKERYFIEFDGTWDIWYDEGDFTFPTYVASTDNLETARLVRDALESFGFTIEDYL